MGEDLANPGSSLHFQSSHFNNQVRVPGGAGGGGPGQPRLQPTLSVQSLLTIYAPMIYTAPCIMFWMRAYPLRGEVVGGWVLEFLSSLGPVKWHRADRQVPFKAHFPK